MIRRSKNPDALRRTMLFRTLQRLIARGEPTIRRAVLQAITAIQNGTRVAAVQTALARGDIDAAVNVIPWDLLQRGPYAERLSRALRNVYAPVGAAEIRKVGGRNFDVLNPRGLKFLRDRGAELVVQITSDTRAGLRRSVTRMLERGLPAQRAAQLIRPQIGLYDRLQDALDAYQQKLIDKGYPDAEIVRDTERYAIELRQYRAMMISRTESAFAGNVAHREAWEQAAAQDLFDPATATRVWVASPSEATCPICTNMDGVEVGFYEEFTTRADGVPYEPTYAGISGAFDASYMRGDPPAHPNCLPGDTVVTAGSRITAAVERRYEGELVVIRTRSGQRLAASPNHPILTPAGWVAACRVNEIGAVVRSCLRDRGASRDLHNQDRPARLKEVADTFRQAPNVASRPMPVAPEYFHGDGGGSEIAVIWTDRLLRNGLNPAFQEHPRESFFIRRFVPATPLVRRCPHGKLRDGHCPTPRRRVRGLRDGHPAFHGLLLPPELTSSSNATQRHPVPLERVRQREATDAQLARELLDARTALIAIDEVRDVEVQSFHGPLLNLETTDGWYIANGLITHNCACTVVLRPDV